MPEDPRDLPTESGPPASPAEPPAAVVGLGGSAGSLESYEQFLTSLPDGGGLALVVVAHQGPEAGRGLGDLLARCTALPVEEVTDGLALQPGRVYVAPAGRRVSLLNGTLLLGGGGDGHLPIDTFFESLAADQGPRAVGVVFSGAGQDGRRGLAAIKAAGGLAFVQHPDGAQHPGMPRAAAETGVADAVLPPEDLAAELYSRVTRSPSLRAADVLTAGGQPSPALQKVLLHVRARTGQDFSGYKQSTLVRRIDRRMGGHGIQDLATYARFLAEHPAETGALFRDLLINVTSFFRDPPAFAALGAQVRAYLDAHPDLTSFRVWVPGCSTGEEAYSLAILLSEIRESLDPGRPLHVQVFATDLDQEAIETARAGFYPGQIGDAVGPERLARYFVPRDGGHQVVTQVRELVVFAKHNTFGDPPFTRLDLLSCRNLLIYLGPELQAQVLPLFHYALKPGGLLLLGPSESLGAARSLFAPLDLRWKLFRRQGQGSAVTLPFGAPTGLPPLPRPALPPSGEAAPGGQDPRAGVARAVQHLLLSEWTPPTVTVDAQGSVVYVSGSTGAYLELPSGSPSTKVLELARPALRYELSAALRQAADTGQEVRHPGVTLAEGGGGGRTLDLIVRPLRLPQHSGPLYVIVFQDRERLPLPGDADGRADSEGRVTELERELRYTKEYLQTAVEEMEVSLEERKSTNEELQTANEELQSSNEELMSSKEELQSLNEELVTINAEHQVIISDLQQANDDMKNLLDSIGVATLFLDNDLRIKRFTPKITAVANLIGSDVGRPIGDITFNLRHEGLQDDLARVLQSLTPFETQVRTRDGAWFLMRISPYRTFDNFIDGVVVVFLSVDHLKRLETQAHTSHLYADAVLNTMHDPVVVLDGHLRVVTGNAALARLLDSEPAEVQGERLYDLGLGQFDQPEFTRALRDVVLGHAAMHDFLLDFETAAGARRALKVNAEQLADEGADTDLVLLWMEDVTDLLRRAAEAGAEAERGGGEEA